MLLQLPVFKICFEKNVYIQPSNTQTAISSINGANVGHLSRSSKNLIYSEEDLLKEASKSKFFEATVLGHIKIEQISS